MSTPAVPEGRAAVTEALRRADIAASNSITMNGTDVTLDVSPEPEGVFRCMVTCGDQSVILRFDGTDVDVNVMKG